MNRPPKNTPTVRSKKINITAQDAGFDGCYMISTNIERSRTNQIEALVVRRVKKTADDDGPHFFLQGSTKVFYDVNSDDWYPDSAFSLCGALMQSRNLVDAENEKDLSFYTISPEWLIHTGTGFEIVEKIKVFGPSGGLAQFLFFSRALTMFDGKPFVATGACIEIGTTHEWEVGAVGGILEKIVHLFATEQSLRSLIFPLVNMRQVLEEIPQELRQFVGTAKEMMKTKKWKWLISVETGLEAIELMRWYDANKHDIDLNMTKAKMGATVIRYMQERQYIPNGNLRMGTSLGQKLEQNVTNPNPIFSFEPNGTLQNETSLGQKLPVKYKRTAKKEAAPTHKKKVLLKYEKEL